MELPKIIESMLPQKKSIDDRIIALIISPYHIKCSLTQIATANILGVGEEEYEEGWENAIKAADMAIAKATNGIENANQIKKVIFSLPYDWVENDKIKPENLQNLKKLSQDLDLTPLGFVVTSEAIIHYLQKTEGSPLTAILVDFSLKEIFVTLVHAGKKEEIQKKEISENIVEDFKSLLAKFSAIEIFPSRILLYDHRSDLEKIKEEFLAYSWQKFPGFLHFPKVEILEKDIDLKSAVLAGFTELGIVIDQKIQEESKPVVSEVTEFVEGKDVLENEEIKQTEEPKEEIQIFETQKEEVVKEEIKITPPVPEKISKIVTIKKMFSSLNLKSNKFKLSLIFLPVFLFMISGIAFAAYYYVPKAKVTLVLETRTLEQNLTVTISNNIQGVDVDNRKIPAQFLSADVSGQKATTATGKKTIGDPAKGEVTVYNKTESTKTFAKGTEILTSKNLKFTLDNDVSIASQSADSGTWGNSKVKVTAGQIGTDSNLNSGTTFTLKGYSSDSYSAKNEQSFAGGTSRDVTVISKDDQSRLKDALTKELEDKAMQTLKEKIASGEVILEKGLTSTVQTASFDKEVGAEAKDTTLNLTLKFNAPYYKDSDLKTLTQKILEKDIPDGFVLKPEDINFTVDKVTTAKDVTTVSLNVKASLLPILDTQKIQKDIAGKYPEVLDSYFKQIPSVAGYEIKITPPLPKKISTLPRILGNISINIIAR